MSFCRYHYLGEHLGPLTAWIRDVDSSSELQELWRLENEVYNEWNLAWIDIPSRPGTWFTVVLQAAVSELHMSTIFGPRGHIFIMHAKQ